MNIIAENKKIVFCRNIHWGDVIRINTHSMASEFIHHDWQCGWISRMMTPWRMFYKGFQEARRIWKSGGSQHPGIFEYSPLFMLAHGTAPVLRSRAIWEASPSFTFPGLQSTLNKVNLNDPNICWIGSLSMGAIGLHIGAKKIVYQAHDAFSLYPGATPNIKLIESEMVKQASIVVTTSEATRQLLQELYPRYSERIFTLTHGVNISEYQGEFSEPNDIQQIPKPRAIIIGTLNLQDDNLIIFSAKSLPNVSFILIGPGGSKIDQKAKVLKLENVNWLGPRIQSDLPAYLKFCDVGLIAYPFNLRDTRRYGCNPMKRYEYAAAGLPTVSVNLHEYSLTPSPIIKADSQEEFVDGIISALTSTEKYHKALIDFSRMNSWNEKYHQLIDLIQNKT